MYKVKFTPYRENLGTIMSRQTAGHSYISSNGKYKFYIDEEIEDPDFWVIQGKGVRHPQTCFVAPKNTILLTTEPRSVLVYPQKYIKQFGVVCSCQEKTKHPDLRLGPAILPWHVGFIERDKCIYTKDYDELKSSPTPEKTKLISVITSNKAFTQGHIDRIEFVERLKAYYGDQLDVYGRGYRDFEDKWDVLAPYKYHISIENSSQKYYWTEKISDSFLTETFPLYYGCTNLKDYFPEKAFQTIDIHDFQGAINIINQCIKEDRYEKSTSVLKECKELVLEEYNMFNYTAALCDTLDPNLPKEKVTMLPCHSMQNWQNFYRYSIERNLFKWKQKLKESCSGKSILTSSNA